MNKNCKKDNGSKVFLNELFGILETIFISMFIMSMIFTYILKVVAINGNSMEKTIFQGDRVVASLIVINPSVGDVVIVDADEAVLLDENGKLMHKTGLNKQIIKRIIAVEGQTIDIDFEKGIVSVDGSVLDEPYAAFLTHLDEGAFTGQYPVTVPKGYVFVMGDNRNVSKDSRSEDIGFVSVDSIWGKVLFRLAPLDKFGFIE